METKQIFAHYDDLPTTQVNANVTRRLTHLNDLMLVIVDFTNGPMTQPDPPHWHEAEQITYVAQGECLVFIGDQKKHLKEGDMFAVPSKTPHTIQSITPTLRLIDSFNPIRKDFL
jgi:quercetin dioxygenase-like cupin family protein